MAFVSTVFASWYLRSDDNWGYHRDLHGDCSYYDRDRYYDHDRDWRDDFIVAGMITGIETIGLAGTT